MAKTADSALTPWPPCRLLYPVFLLLLLAAGTAYASEASKLAKRARRAELSGQIPQAYLLYAEAAALEPENQWYWLKSQALRSRAAMIAKPKPKPLPDATDSALPDETPEAHFDSPTERDWAEARKPLPPQTLAATPGLQDFDLKGDSKVLFERVAHAYGLDCVFDTDYQPTRPFAFRMQQAGYREALRALEASTASFVVPLTPKLFLVAKDSQQKRNDVEPNMSVTIELTQPTAAQELTGLITAVQQATGLTKVSWDTQRNVVILRGGVSKVLVAQQVFEDLLQPRAQVEIDVKFLEISQADAWSFGLSLPTSLQFFPLTHTLNNLPAVPSGVTNLLVFGGGASMIGMAVADAQLMAKMTQSRSKMLLQTQIRSIDGQPATIHIGDKYPIMTSGYFGATNSAQSANYYTPTPSFTFEDLGLEIKATPKVHGTGDVTMDLEAAYKVLTGTGVNGIPIISSRELKSTVTLNTGEWAIVAGLLQAQEARLLTGIYGLSSLPLLGPLIKDRDQSKNNNAVLIMVRPRLLTAPPSEVVTRTYRLGSEARPLSPL